MRRTSGQKLTELAAALKPARAPYYVRERPFSLVRQFPAEGWYWVPPGSALAVFLAKNYDEARDVLRDLLAREEAEHDLQEANHP